jgi:hypothetical protein
MECKKCSRIAKERIAPIDTRKGVKKRREDV